MKKLYKKISAILVAGAIVIGCSLSSSHAMSMKEFSEQEGLQILARASNQQDLQNKEDDILKKIKEPSRSRVKSRFKDGAPVPIKDINDLINLKKSNMQLHKVSSGDYLYIIQFDQESLYGASRKPDHKFPNRMNQRIYDIMDFYQKRRHYNIVLVADSRSYGQYLEYKSKIRSFPNKHVSAKLLKEPDKVFKEPSELIRHLKSKNQVFGGKGYHRVKAGNLDFIIEVK